MRDVAIIGIGCRLPGGTRGPQALWSLVLEGRDVVSERPAGRWEDACDDPHLLAGLPSAGGFLDDVAGFDAAEFGISPAEALTMDPHQRLALEVAREALDDAGIPPGCLAGSATAVVLGAAPSDYGRLVSSRLADVDPRTVTGLSPALVANRISYLLDLRGPSVTVDTACSSSLVALHQAVAALRDGDADLALTGGVNLMLGPAATASFAAAGVLAADGRCKPFSEGADGIARGEGCVLLVLQRLDDALAAGHRVLAVVRGSAVGSDGRSNGLTAPNPDAQEDVLRRAYRRAGADPAQVGFVETHGTGTLLGDLIEAAALSGVVGADRAPGAEAYLGAVKGSLGHLEAAAGAAGLAVAALALHHGTIPPARFAATPSSRIPFGRNGLALAAEPLPWPPDRPLAGVSGFGFGGTNAHVVLGPAPTSPPEPAREAHAARAAADAPDAPAAPAVLVVGGATPEHVATHAASLADWLEDRPERQAPSLHAVAHSLLRGRGPGRTAGTVAVRDAASAIAALRALAADPRPVPVPVSPATTADAVWVFSGFGPLRPGVARGLLDRPAFADALADVDPLIRAACGVSVLGVVSGDPAAAGGAAPLLVDTVVRFAVQVGLARLWESVGARPAAVVGHSTGEVSAAFVAGLLSAPDAARVVVARAELVAAAGAAGGGAMAVVEAPADAVAAVLADHPGVEVAVHAAPDGVTLAGPAAVLAAATARLLAAGHRVWDLGVDGAGHSAALDPLLPALVTRIGPVGARPPRVPFYGTVLDDPRAEPSFDADYWAANARRPVRFTQAVAAAAADGHRLFVEVSPHPVTLPAIRSTLRAAGRPGAALATLRPGVPAGDDEAAFLASAGALLVAGGRVDPEAVVPCAARVTLPPVAWRHVRFWPASRGGRATATTGDDALAGTAVPAPRPGPPTIDASDPDAARALVLDRVLRAVGEISGYPAGSVRPDRSLHDLGLDSLMAVRVCNVLAADVGVTLSPALLLGGATPEDVAGQALSQLLTGAAGPGPAATPTAEPEPDHVLGGRDPVERWVASVWEDAIGRAPLDVVAAVPEIADAAVRGAIVARLRERVPAATGDAELGGLPVEGLFETGTIEAQAGLLRPLLAARPDDPLTVLRAASPDDVAPPLFLFHPAGAGCGTYQPLVSRLPAGFAVYGLERDDRLRTVEAKAARYAGILRSAQPTGPYRLAGWSFGGCLAYAVADRFAAEGLDVDLVALVDTIAPSRGETEEDEREGLRERFRRFFAHLESSYGLTLGLSADDVADLPDEQTQIETVLAAMQQAGVPLSPAVIEHQRASYIDTRIAERYRPPRYAGPTVLYRTSSAGWTGMIDPRYEHGSGADDWDVVAERMEVVHVDGDHSSIIDPPHVDAVAAHLGGLLTRVRAGAPQP